MREVVTQLAIDCDTPLPEVWAWVTDTQRLNRLAGMAPIDTQPLDDESAGRYLCKTVLGGFRVQYIEEPYEWDQNHSFRVSRRMLSGPVTLTRMHYLLLPRAGRGCRLVLRALNVPRYRLLGPIIAYSARRVLGRLARVIATWDKSASAYLHRPPPHALSARLARLRADPQGRWRSYETDALRRLLSLCEPHDVAYLRPFVLAERWQMRPERALALCLAAARARLLTYRWEVLCPSCRLGTRALLRPEDFVPHGKACHWCNLAPVSDPNDALELVFAAHPALCRITPALFCAGAPAKTPHVVCQTILPARGVAAARMPGRPGDYALFVRDLGQSLRLRAEWGGPKHLSLSVPIDPHHRPGATVALSPVASLTLHNSLLLSYHVRVFAQADLTPYVRPRDVAQNKVYLALQKEQFP